MIDPKDREYLKTEDSSLIKDTYTGALLSSDIHQLKQHKIRHKQFERSKVVESEINSIKEEIDTLRDDLGEIKSLLKHLIINKED